MLLTLLLICTRAFATDVPIPPLAGVLKAPPNPMENNKPAVEMHDGEVAEAVLGTTDELSFNFEPDVQVGNKKVIEVRPGGKPGEITVKTLSLGTSTLLIVDKKTKKPAKKFLYKVIPGK